MFIYNKSIPQILLEKSKLKCLTCAKEKEEDLFTLSCNCILCDDCLTKKINISTENRILLTKYEKSKIFF